MIEAVKIFAHISTCVGQLQFIFTTIMSQLLVLLATPKFISNLWPVKVFLTGPDQLKDILNAGNSC